MTEPILVTGFLGAGKSALAARLRAALPERQILEADGRAVPDSLGLGSVVAVADAANLPACLADALVGPLVAAQIRAAGMVLVCRTDLVPAAPALDALAGLTGAPAVETAPGPLPPGLAERIAALRPRPPNLAVVVDFAEWQYAGPAKLTEKSVERLLANRPEGLYRLSGVVRCGRLGVEVEVAGRLRQTRPVPLPGESSLRAVGPAKRFRPDQMALRFSEAAADRGWLAGLFGHR